MKIVRALLDTVLKIKIIHRFAFWANSHFISLAHRRRYPEDFHWHPVAPSPVEKYDVACAQIGSAFYVIGGYSGIDRANSFIDVLDLKTQQWIERISMPAGMGQTHLALTTDGRRYIYAVSGQLGPQCSPAVREGFVFDAHTKSWSALVPLPEARYAATMQLWRGRLHVIGGSMPDRYAPSADHWSIAVKDGRVTETQWRRETPIPLAAQDRPSAIISDVLYVFGGQTGDFIAKPGSLCYECDGRTHEEYFNHTYRLTDPRGTWERLADMPVSASHMSFPAVIGTSVYTFGGQAFKDPKTFQLAVTDVIQKFDTQTGRWSIVGHTPYRLKTPAVAFWDGWVYITTGQRDRGESDAAPGRIDRRTWRTKFPA